MSRIIFFLIPVLIIISYHNAYADTYTSNTPTFDGFVEDSSGNNVCDTSDGVKYNTNDLEINRYATTQGGECDMSYFEYDISSIPANAVVTDVDFSFDGKSTTGGGINCDFVSLGTTRESDTAATIFAAILSGTAMLTNDSTCTTVGDNNSVDLGAVGDSQVQTRVTAGSGFFTFGVKPTNLTLDATWYGEQMAAQNDGTATPKPTLTITYTAGSPPNPITSLTYANLGDNSVDLIYSLPSSNGSGTFQAFVINSTTPWGQPLTFNQNSTHLYANVTGLSFGTQYSFRVALATEIAYNTTGSYILNVTTTQSTFDIPPTSLVASSNNSTKINLQWIAPAMNNINGYKIERETPIDTGWVVIVSNTTNSNNYYNNTGLTTNIIYNYRVSALNGSGSTTPSNEDEMTTYHLPNAVTDLTAMADTFTAIELDWTEPVSYAPEITDYQINYTTPEGSPMTIIAHSPPVTIPPYTARDLSLGETYSFRVSPVTVHGMNATGNIANATTTTVFELGSLESPDTTNTNDFQIFYTRTNTNATSILLDVTYPGSYNLSCNVLQKFSRENNTYTGLVETPVTGYGNDTGTVKSSFIFNGANSEVITVNCEDTISGDSAKYIITIEDFELLDQIANFRNGTYGTMGQIGGLDMIVLIIVLIGMIGFNQVTPMAGVGFTVITVGVAAYFGIIEFYQIMFPAIALVVLLAYTRTRQSD